MKFGDVSVDQARGAILAHTVRAGGGVLKKGTVLGAAELAHLKSAKIETITVARLDAGDVDENSAAETIAHALAGFEAGAGAGIRAGVSVSKPQAGRCNLHASTAGILQLSEDRIHAFNRLGVGVLLATLRAHESVEPGRQLATLKVISYAIAKETVAELVAICADGAISVRPFKPHRVALVLTRVDGVKESLLDKARSVLAARIETCASALCHEARVDHNVPALAAAIGAAKNESDLVLVLGAASTSDVDDVVPAAIKAAGGSVDVFGVPVDPGNLLVSGVCGGVQVLGLPGCARSPSLNAVDLILPRIFTGEVVSKETLLGLGVGGLLHDVAERPQPREQHGEVSAMIKGNVSAVVLAAGQSRRMGAKNKLLMERDGIALVRRVVETALQAGVHDVVVVTGFEADRVRDALAGLDVRFVHNPHFEEGLSTSLRTGIGACADHARGALVMLGDMPDVAPDTIKRLCDGFRDADGTKICRPVHNDRQGNPVLWPAEFFPDMMDIAGDTGARELIQRYKDHMLKVECPDPAIHMDIDTPDDMAD